MLFWRCWALGKLWWGFVCLWVRFGLLFFLGSWWVGRGNPDGSAQLFQSCNLCYLLHQLWCLHCWWSKIWAQLRALTIYKSRPQGLALLLWMVYQNKSSLWSWNLRRIPLWGSSRSFSPTILVNVYSHTKFILEFKLD